MHRTKSIFQIPIFIAVFTFCFVAALPNSSAQINIDEVTFDKEVFDFGTVEFGNPQINATFIFTNNSEFNYEIRDVRASCGCTVPNWPKNPILPGMKGVITARFDPTNLAGEVDKSIEIFANYNDAASKKLKIQGIIKEPVQKDLSKTIPGQFGYLRLSQQVIGFGTVKTSQTVTKEVRIVNDYNRSLKLKEIVKYPEYMDVSFDRLEIASGDTGSLILTIHGEKIGDLGLVNDQVQFNTGDIFFPMKSVKIAMDVKHDFGKLKKKDLRNKPTIDLSETVFDLGVVKEGAKKTTNVVIRNIGKSDLKLLKIKSVCSCALLDGANTTIAPGDSTVATLSFDSIFQSGRVEKEITIYTNDPSNPVIRLMVYAQIPER